MIEGFINDIKRFTPKEMYATPAVLALEVEEYLPAYCIEACSLLFSIKKYKKCCSVDV